jgi:hypothetical protein
MIVFKVPLINSDEYIQQIYTIFYIYLRNQCIILKSLGEVLFTANQSLNGIKYLILSNGIPKGRFKTSQILLKPSSLLVSSNCTALFLSRLDFIYSWGVGSC